MKPHVLAGALGAGLMLAACSHTPMAPPELVEARAAVRSAESRPEVLAMAPVELRSATDALNRANTLHASGESLAEVSSAAHVATQRARTAMAVAQAKSNDEAIRGAEAERERARAEVSAIEAERARAQASAAQAQANAARAQASTAEQRAAGAEQRASGAEQQAAQLQQRLAELQARNTERGVLVTLGDVLFEFNRAEIKPGAQAALQKLADFLQQYPDRRVLIEGYTDNVGSDAYNEALSRRRAEAVAARLVTMGVASQRITATGLGKSHPVADNSTDTNRALNRRVEVYLSNDDRPVRPRG